MSLDPYTYPLHPQNEVTMLWSYWECNFTISLSLTGSLVRCNLISLVACWLSNMIFSKTFGRACLLQIQSLLLLLSSSLVNHSISGQCAMVFPGLSIWDGRWGAKNLLTEAGNCANHSSAHFRNCSFTASIAICCISKLLLIHFYFFPPDCCDMASFSLLELNGVQQSYSKTEVCPYVYQG